jgi:hypothetical protein
MLGRACFCLAILAALAAAPAAAGDGPMFASQGGLGVVAGNGGGPAGVRYVAVGIPNGNQTALEAIETSDGTVGRWMDVPGSWGIPTVGYSFPTSGEGLSHNGRLLVLAALQAPSSPTDFVVVNPRRMAVVKRITLPGYFSYDALSPDASRLYLIQYAEGRSGDLNHYIVRAYDLKHDRLLPGRIADRTQKSWVMQGSAVTRTTSPDGRWVYTLYQNPGGYPFIHALDTVRGIAHCVGLPMSSQNGIYNLVLSLHGRTLAVHWRSGRAWLMLDTATWRLAPASDGFPWSWVAPGIGGALAALAATALVLRRRRHSGELERELGELLREPERTGVA